MKKKKKICLCLMFMILNTKRHELMLNVLYSGENKTPLKKYYIKYLKLELSINKLLNNKMLNSQRYFFP